MEKPFAPSCERNQGVILDVLKDIIKPTDIHLLEIGSGTGQHAVFMAPHFPKTKWHTTDLVENHLGINMWLDEATIDNILQPIIYQSGKSDFPNIDVDIIFTTNTLHIMSWDNVRKLIFHLGDNLKKGAQIIIYGPFNYKGEFTSKSNEKFNGWLKNKNPYSGIREFDSVVSLMTKVDIHLINDIHMPSNNRILHFIKE